VIAPEDLGLSRDDSPREASARDSVGEAVASSQRRWRTVREHLNHSREPPDVVTQQLGHKDGGKLVAQLYGHLEGRVARRRIRDAFAATGQVKPLRVVDEDTG